MKIIQKKIGLIFLCLLVSIKCVYSISPCNTGTQFKVLYSYIKRDFDNNNIARQLLEENETKLGNVFYGQWGEMFIHFKKDEKIFTKMFFEKPKHREDYPIKIFIEKKEKEKVEEFKFDFVIVEGECEVRKVVEEEDDDEDDDDDEGFLKKKIINESFLRCLES